MSAINFVDYFYRKINGVKRVQFDAYLERQSGEGTYLFANGLPIGMATPGDCQGIKMEFDYGVTPTLTTGKMAHGLDIKMTMDQDWSIATRPDNATVRGARIQAVSEDDLSGRITGAYINGRAEGTSKTIGGYSSASLHAGPGIIGIQARSEVAGTITGNAAGILIFHRNTTGATLAGDYRGLQIEQYMGTLGSTNGTITAIYIADDWGGANPFTSAINVAVACTTAINISAVQTVNTGLNAATVLQHGSYSTALAYGTATSGRLLLRVMNITAAGTAVSVMGDFVKITSSAASTGSLFGHYGYISLGHDTAGAYAMKARLELTASAALGLVSGMLITTGISGTTTLTSGTNAHISGLHIAMSIASGVVDVAQEVMGLYVQTSGIAKDVTGNKIGIKVEHGGGSNYLDYGLYFSNCFHNATAVIGMQLTQGNVASGIVFEVDNGHTLSSALTFVDNADGAITYFADFSGTDGSTGNVIEKDSTAKSGQNQGWIIVRDSDGNKGYVNVWAS